MVNEPKWQVTLRLIAAFGRFCARFRLLWILLAVAAAGWFGVLFAGESGHSARLLLPLSLLLWSLLGLCAGFWLGWSPAPIHASDNLLIKIRKYMIISGYIVLILLVIGLGAGALSLTLRGIGLNADG